MSQRQPFHPAFGQGATVSPAASSGSSTIGRGSKNIAFTNLGVNVCYVRVGTGAQTATTADYPVPANAQVVVTKDQDADTVAYISASGTTLHIMPGEGW